MEGKLSRRKRSNAAWKLVEQRRICTLPAHVMATIPPRLVTLSETNWPFPGNEGTPLFPLFDAKLAPNNYFGPLDTRPLDIIARGHFAGPRFARLQWRLLSHFIRAPKLSVISIESIGW